MASNVGMDMSVCMLRCYTNSSALPGSLLWQVSKVIASGAGVVA